jgi:lipoprotein signal peptidase
MKFLKYIFLGLFLIFLDQLTKLFFNGQINRGISFGLFESLPNLFFVLLLIIISALLLKSSLSKFFSIFFLAGATSNLVDRLMFEGVRDWLSIPGFNFSNNFADIWISLGLLGIIFFELRKTKKNEQRD